MEEIKTIAVVCNYELKSDRIGGMDRFFKAYNLSLLKEGKKVKWFFSGGEIFNFYQGFDLHLSMNGNVEEFFLDDLEAHENVDVVVTHFIALCTPFYKNIRNKGVKKIIAVDHNPRPLHGFPWQKRIRNKIKGKLYSKYIDLFVGVSQYTADSILKDYGRKLASKTVVVYNGIDTSIYLKRTENNHGKFIVASHLRRSKGIQDLIEAVNILPIPIKGSILIDIYGEGPLLHFLQEKVKAYKLQGQINFLGSSPDLPVVFQHYSYMIQPTYMECFSLSILESLSANVPVITTPVGGNLEIVKHTINGLIFEPGNIPALAILIESVLKKGKGLDKNVSSNIEENYNLEKMVEGHLNLLPCI